MLNLRIVLLWLVFCNQKTAAKEFDRLLTLQYFKGNSGRALLSNLFVNIDIFLSASVQVTRAGIRSPINFAHVVSAVSSTSDKIVSFWFAFQRAA